MPHVRIRAYTATGAAHRLNVSIWTIRRWTATGQLTPITTRGPHGQHLYAETDLINAERNNANGRAHRKNAA